MPSDANIVRCAAPWPGTAARLLQGLASLGPGKWRTDQVCTASGSGTETGQAWQVLTGLAEAGVCACASDDDAWVSDFAPTELLRLAHVLTGADHFRRMRLTPASIELAVTMPLAPSYLEKQLAATLNRPGGFLSTSAAFVRLAQAATERLVVMSPFIDQAGFRWLKRLFESVPTTCQRVVVVRNAADYSVELGVQHAEWLQRLDVSVRDYYLSHTAGTGRSLPVETFHAKIVLADQSLAYVGSANFLNSSEAVSLETGLLVAGDAVAQVSRLVDAVLRVARQL